MSLRPCKRPGFGKKSGRKVKRRKVMAIRGTRRHKTSKVESRTVHTAIGRLPRKVFNRMMREDVERRGPVDLD